MIRSLPVLLPLALLVMLLGACTSEQALDQQLRELIVQHQLDQPFERDAVDDSALLAALGQQLFFSPDLSIDGSVACASCHHPTQGGADGLALPVGIGGLDAEKIGQQRLDAAYALNPELDLQGIIPRNTPTVFNAVLFRQRLFWDGRVQYTTDPNQPGVKKVMQGVFPAQHNPSNYVQDNLLQTQARLPMTSNFEMKGAQAPHRNNHEIEQDILHFLQSQERWCVAFAKVFGLKPCADTLTLTNLTRAIAAFEARQVFTDSPFQRYISGDTDALTAQQKRGAIAFLTRQEQGGAGCVNCHSGNAFTNERFYNINIPPGGRGANESGWDLGRHNVDRTAERFSFRVPSLLNVALTAPYFHNGVALSLEDAIRFKQTAADVHKPAKQLLLDDFDYATITAEIARDFASGAARALLPERLSDNRIDELAAFLRSLSDSCLSDRACAETLVAPAVKSPRPATTAYTADQHGTTHPRQSQPQPPPALDCSRFAVRNDEPAGNGFSMHAIDIGLDHQRTVGLIRKGWLIDVVNYASVAAVDTDFDCLDELLFDAGDAGLVLYRQQDDGRFQRQAVPYRKAGDAVNALMLDLDGDYRQDLFIGSYGQSPAAVVFDFQQRANDVVQLSALTGPVINASAGDINGDGQLDLVFGLWRSFSSFKQPHLWFGDGHGNLSSAQGFIHLRQSNQHVGGDEFIKRQSRLDIGGSDLTFTPNLLDVDGDGAQDLLLAADFFRSQILLNRNGRLQDVTDKAVIDDTNGMGAAIGDFDHNGTPDWFVTSIVDRTLPGLSRGHRLYRNLGNGNFAQAPVINKDVEWSWGACSADFNNDGHLDIAYVSGYGETLHTARYESAAQQQASENFYANNARYAGSRLTLLINDGAGGFRDQSADYGLTQTLDGRGIACFDYQQDGDIDIVVAPIEGAPVLLRNNLDRRQHWIALRVIGPPGNTEAFGTRVELYTANGIQHRQVRFENNFVSRNPAQLHFGLGELDRIDKVVLHLPAPSATTVELENPAPNRLHVLHWQSLTGAGGIPPVPVSR